MSTPAAVPRPGERRWKNNLRLRTRIQSLRLAEHTLSVFGHVNEAALVRGVIDDLVAEHNCPDPLGEALNSGDGTYKP